MTLDEIKTEEEMIAAFAEGDDVLKRDIARAVERVWASRSTNTPDWENLSDDELKAKVVDAVGKGEKLLKIIEDFRTASQVQDALRIVPPARVAAAIQDEIDRGASAYGAGGGGGQMLSFVTGKYIGTNLGPSHYEVYVSFAAPLSWVPVNEMLEILRSLESDGEWESLGDDTYSSGWIPNHSEPWMLTVNADAAEEWADDLRREYFSDLVDAHPETAIREFLRIVKAEHPELSKGIKKAKFPQEVLADYAVTYFDDPDDGIHIITEAVGSFGYEGTRGEVLLEIDRAALQAMGITEGRWWDGAPWRLLNLPPEELAYEGTLQRHCVGRHSMGYRDAVRRGDTQIWSLRSQWNKPILTFEINLHEWQSRDPLTRAGAIEQLKGKLNRLAGEDADEAMVLHWIFAKLGVDPAGVQDFSPSRNRNPARQARTFDAAWHPYPRRSRATRSRGQRVGARSNPSSDRRHQDLKRKLMR
jgi:hypothetical protein